MHPDHGIARSVEGAVAAGASGAAMPLAYLTFCGWVDDEGETVSVAEGLISPVWSTAAIHDG